MADIHITRIQHALSREFQDKIDTSDLTKYNEEQIRDHFLSRALAAYCIKAVAEVDADTAARSVTDGFDDNGLDAVMFDQASNTLIFAQSKFIKDGNGSPELGDLKKFLGGLEDLVNLRFSRFNDKVKKRSEEITSALQDAEVQLQALVAYTGTQPLSKQAKEELSVFASKFNDPAPVLTVHVYDQKKLYELISSAPEKEILLEIGLREWGHVDLPYKAFYGQATLSDVRDWWSKYGDRLFARNLRGFKGRTDVNESLATTIRNEPKHFWYFNNGVTLLARKVAKKPLGGSSRDWGVFECSGVSAVNGAQTVGMIGTTKVQKSESSEEGYVLVRIVSLENCPNGFDDQMTRNTNTQNRIEKHDFASLDENQQRLAREMRLDGKTYVYRAGERKPTDEEGCDILEATTALACSVKDAIFAVMAKTGTGRFFEDLNANPYKTLFNDTTSAIELWRSVLITREVDRHLEKLRQMDAPRSQLVAVHGNRMLLHRVFRHPKVLNFRMHDWDVDQIIGTLPAIAENEFQHLCADLEKNHQSSYLASLFKNVTKCRDLDSRLDEVNASLESHARTTLEEPEEKTDPTLFDGMPE